MKLRQSPILARQALALTILYFHSLLFSVVLVTPSLAEWKISGEGSMYYTDDVALFSATRRLSRDQDPTQPAIDAELADQGNDVIFEPDLQIVQSFGSDDRVTTLSIRGQGFVFTDNSRFNHGTLGVEGRHELSPTTTVGVRYYFSPDLLLGENTEKRSGLALPANEKVTTNFGAVGIKQKVSQEVELTLYSRYGARTYNKAFSQRDIRFWTIGMHADWDAREDIALAIGYHYERGLADGRHQPEFKDDISYFNHFVTTEAVIGLMERLDLELAMHYEFNGWTTGIQGDPRKGQHEDIIQGDLQLRFQPSKTLDLMVGFQGAHRKESDEDGLRNLNVWVGGKMVF